MKYIFAVATFMATVCCCLIGCCGAWNLHNIPVKRNRPRNSVLARKVAIDPSLIDPPVFVPRGITAQDTAVFAVGILPFAWASVEFWRRIAVGESFGTGKDSIIIGEDQSPESSRGRRVLGKDAFLAAYVLFAIAGASLVLAALSGAQLFET